MVSTKYKFVFVHIYKNGGSSIRSALSEYSDDRTRDYVLDKAHTVVKRITGIDVSILKSLQKYPNHISAKNLYGILEEPESYFKFAFVRNPWDAQVSHYHYGKRAFWGPEYKIYRSLSNFEEYMEWRSKVGQKTQKSFIYDNDECLVDFVGKYENLSEDFEQICSHLSLQASLPTLNVSKRDSYKNYYSDKTRQQVAELFKDDIEAFGYSY